MADCKLVPGQEIRIIMELPDGTTFSGVGMAVQIEQSIPTPPRIDVTSKSDPVAQHILGVREPGFWSVTVEGSGNPLWTGSRNEAIARVPQGEWMCDFCGAIHPKHVRQCSQCAGWRSFLYDL